MSTNGNGTHQEWRDLAEQVSRETDSEKLLMLVRELCNAIDHRGPSLAQDKPVDKKSDVPTEE